MRSLRPVTDTPPRAVIYMRQSTFREESISLELQEIACRDYCAKMGYTVFAVEADPGISGRTWIKRPKVQEVMASIEAGDADVIVLWKWSRLSRSRKDWAVAADRVDVAGGRIESATEPIDTATASGRFARGVMTEYAAFQSEQIGEQWEEVRQRRLGLGLPASGRLPFGWLWGDDAIHPDPERAPLVVEMYRRYLAGDGSTEIAKWLNTESVPAPNGGEWSRARPFTVLDSPIHAGFIPYRGSTYPGAHDPIIDTATWDAYQRERAARREGIAQPRRYDHPLSGLVVCPCGARMHGKGSVTDGKWYGGYICAFPAQSDHPGRAYISAKTLHPVVMEWFETFDPQLPTGAAPGVAARAARDRILREMNELEVELSTLTRQLGREVIGEAAYRLASAEIQAELVRLRQEERKHASAKVAPTSAELSAIRALMEERTMQEKNRALRQVVERIDIGQGGSAVLTTTWGDSSVLIR